MAKLIGVLLKIIHLKINLLLNISPEFNRQRFNNELHTVVKKVGNFSAVVELCLRLRSVGLWSRALETTPEANLFEKKFYMTKSSLCRPNQTRIRAL